VLQPGVDLGPTGDRHGPGRRVRRGGGRAGGCRRGRPFRRGSGRVAGSRPGRPFRRGGRCAGGGGL
jgi:hypothetical protein